MKWCFDMELETGDGHRAVRDRSAAAEALRTSLTQPSEAEARPALSIVSRYCGGRSSDAGPRDGDP